MHMGDLAGASGSVGKAGTHTHTQKGGFPTDPCDVPTPPAVKSCTGISMCALPSDERAVSTREEKRQVHNDTEGREAADSFGKPTLREGHLSKAMRTLQAQINAARLTEAAVTLNTQ